MILESFSRLFQKWKTVEHSRVMPSLYMRQCCSEWVVKQLNTSIHIGWWRTQILNRFKSHYMQYIWALSIVSPLSLCTQGMSYNLLIVNRRALIVISSVIVYVFNKHFGKWYCVFILNRLSTSVCVCVICIIHTVCALVGLLPTFNWRVCQVNKKYGLCVCFLLYFHVAWYYKFIKLYFTILIK